MKWLLRPTGNHRSGRHRPGAAASFVPAPRLPVPAVYAPAKARLATRVILGFQDGSATVLDSDDETAAALQTVAARLRADL